MPKIDCRTMPLSIGRLAAVIMFTFGILVGASGVAPAQAAACKGYQDALDTYSGWDEEALACWQEKCAQGDAQQCLNRGTYIRRNNTSYRELDLGEARRALEFACRNRLGEACHQYAEMVQAGHGGPANLADARIYFDRACVIGVAKSCAVLAGMAFKGEGGPKDFQVVKNALQTACELEAMGACMNYASFLYEQKNPNDMPSVRWALNRVCEGTGGIQACFNLALLRSTGSGGAKDLEGAMATLTKLCQDEDYPDACTAAADLKMADLKDAGAVAEARQLFYKGCESGKHDSCFQYARMLEEGLGGEADAEMSQKYFQALCNKYKHQASCPRIK